MKHFILMLISIFLISCKDQGVDLSFSIDLNNRADDQFHVTLMVDGLTESNNIFQFASTAPGTYQTMDIGRFVRSFKAFDENGKEIKTEKLGLNQYSISQPLNVSKITYSIAETWDTPVKENKIYLMCGTSIEDDHVLINGQAVFGYFHGLQSQGFKIKLNYPESWEIGTALNKTEDYYLAYNYDHAVDSPILLGRLSKAVLKVKNTDVEVYTYSKTDMIKSEMILTMLEDMLIAAGEFTNGLPVDRYAFLFHFEDQTNGAWEHSYSSEYVYTEMPFDQIKDNLMATASHEFFHIVTPLNIHSELVAKFNFVKPTASKHIWLYEGTTEWASNILLLRNKVIDLERYFEDLSQKVQTDNYFTRNFGEKKYSLIGLSENSFSLEGQQQYANIYYHGALVAGLLDIKLLELSKGTRGLREVINELTVEYGKSKPFNDASFIQDFVNFTYPEIQDFFDKYIIGKEKLPLAEYYQKIAIRYSESLKTGKTVISLGLGGIPEGDRIKISQIGPEMNDYGMKVGDIIMSYNGEDITLKNAQATLGKISSSKIGDPFEFVIQRDGKTKSIKGQLPGKEEIKQNVFMLDENASDEQKRLRDLWLRNL